MKFPIFTMFLVLLISSCNTDEEAGLIVHEIKQHCIEVDTCHINMSLLLKLDWDKMYIFKESASLEFINNKLGFKYPFYADVARRVIFTKGNSVVYHEDPFPSVESPRNHELFFVLPDTSDYVEFDKKTAMFSVQKRKVSDKTIFSVTPVR